MLEIAPCRQEALDISYSSVYVDVGVLRGLLLVPIEERTSSLVGGVRLRMPLRET